MIDSYSFGQMVVGGQTFTSDLIIFSDRIQSSWWRESGHRLVVEDLEDVFSEDLEVLVIGTGLSGLMKVEDEVKHLAQAKGIELIVDKTEKAVQRFNEVCVSKQTIGAFHLTC